jgi:hypothetical protein
MMDNGGARDETRRHDRREARDEDGPEAETKQRAKRPQPASGLDPGTRLFRLMLRPFGIR